MKQRMRLVLLLAALLAPVACAQAVEPFSAAYFDRAITLPSSQPLASKPELVGTYLGHAKSGGGYFYDEVLEYRVWLHPEKGAPDVAGGEDYFAAFARFESALTYSQATKGAEPPLGKS